MSNKKNSNSINEEDLKNVSGGVVGPDPIWYAINAKGVQYGSDEFNDICNKYGVDPSISMDSINERQNNRMKRNSNYRRRNF